MKFTALILTLFVLVAGTVNAQDYTRLWPNGTTGSISADNGTVTVTNARGMATFAVQVSGTFTGTLTPQCSINGTDFTNITDRMVAINGTSTVDTFTGAGIWQGPVAGCAKLRIIGSSWSNGTAVVTLDTVQTSNSTPLAATLNLESAELTVGAQPADDPHFVKCSDGAVAAPCLVTLSGSNTVTVTDGSGALNVIVDSGTVTAVTSITNPVTVTDGSGALNVIIDSSAAIPITDNSSSITVDGTVTVTDGSGALNVIVDSSAAIPVTDNGGSLTVDGTVSCSNCSGSGVSVNEDVASAGGDPGTPAYTVRQDTPAGSTSADGDYQPLKTDSVGRLWVNCPTCSGSGASQTEDAAHSSGDSGNFVMGIRRDTTPSSSAGTAGDYAAVNIDANGRLYTNAVLYAADGSALAQDTGGTHDTTLGTITSITGAVWGGYANSSAPTNVTAGDWTVGWFDLAGRVHVTGDSSMTALKVDGSGVTQPVSGTVTVTDGSGALNTIIDSGTVTTVSTVTSLSQFAGNDINLSSGTIGTGTLRMTIATDDPVNDAAVKLDANMVAHDAGDAGNPVKVGAFAETSVAGRTMVSDGDRTDIVAGVDGVIITRPHANLEDILQDRATNTDGNSTAFAGGLAAPGSGVRIWLLSCTVSNTATTGGTIDVRDGTSGSVLWTLPVPAAAASSAAGVTHTWTVPLKFTANTAVAYDVSAALSTVTISCNGFKSKL